MWSILEEAPSKHLVCLRGHGLWGFSWGAFLYLGVILRRWFNSLSFSHR
jgi:hypothetical protein